MHIDCTLKTKLFLLLKEAFNIWTVEEKQYRIGCLFTHFVHFEHICLYTRSTRKGKSYLEDENNVSNMCSACIFTSFVRYVSHYMVDPSFNDIRAPSETCATHTLCSLKHPLVSELNEIDERKNTLRRNFQKDTHFQYI